MQRNLEKECSSMLFILYLQWNPLLKSYMRVHSKHVSVLRLPTKPVWTHSKGAQKETDDTDYNMPVA